MAQIKRTRVSNIANWLTATRIILVFVVIFLMLYGDFYLRSVAFFLVVFIILMDWIDGYAANKLNIRTKFGAVFDIIGDRITENIFWIFFAYLALIPIWAPIIVITRSFITDGLRSIALTKGKTAFGKKTMMHSRIGQAIASSRLSRGSYGFLKALVFSIVAGFYAFQSNLSADVVILVQDIIFVLVVITVAFCVVRGIAVIYDSRRYMV